MDAASPALVSAPSARRSTTAAQRREPRALRTREAIVAAIRDAVSEVPLEALSVSEICRRAGVHRVTFYGHWPDASSAIIDAFASLIDRVAAVDVDIVAAARTPRELAARYEAALAGQFIQIIAHRPVYRALMASPAFEQELFRALHARAEAAIAALEALGTAVPGSGSGIAAAQLSGGVVAASTAWARSDQDDVDAVTVESIAQLPGWWPRI
ncbi:TetR/AcrR family transcriptional regulator [Microbacterium sp. GXF6406]